MGPGPGGGCPIGPPGGGRVCILGVVFARTGPGGGAAPGSRRETPPGGTGAPVGGFFSAALMISSLHDIGVKQ